MKYDGLICTACEKPCEIGMGDDYLGSDCCGEPVQADCNDVLSDPLTEDQMCEIFWEARACYFERQAAA